MAPQPAPRLRPFGGDWELVGLVGEAVVAVWADVARRGTLYATSPSGLYVSRDAGRSFTRAGTLEGIACGSVLVFGKTLYVASAEGLYISRDDGKSWERHLSPLAGRSLAVDKHGSILASTQNGLFRSWDRGKFWERIDTPGIAGGIAPLVASLRKSALFGVVRPELFVRRFDGSEQFERRVMRLDAFHPMGVEDLALGESDEGVVLYAATVDGLARSLDSGTSWAIAPGTSGGVVHSVQVDPDDPRHVYIASSEGVFESIDQGASFRAHWLPGDKTSFMGRFAIDAGDPSVLYLGTDRGLYRLRTAEGGSVASQPPVSTSPMPAAVMTLPAQGLPALVEKPAVKVAAFVGLSGDRCRPDYEKRETVCVHAWYASVTPPAQLVVELESYRTGAASPVVGGDDGNPIEPPNAVELKLKQLMEEQLRAAQEAYARGPDPRTKLDPGALMNPSGSRAANEPDAPPGTRTSSADKSLADARARNAQNALVLEVGRSVMKAQRENENRQRKVNAVLDRAKAQGLVDERGQATSPEAEAQLERELKRAAPEVVELMRLLKEGR